MLRPHPISTLFPYTTLFRSSPLKAGAYAVHADSDDTNWLRSRSRTAPMGGRIGGVTVDFQDVARSQPAIGLIQLRRGPPRTNLRSEEHTSELQSLAYLVCRL